jgi:hypothetical protein
MLIVDEPGQDRFYLLGLETERSVPQLLRRWRRRSWIEFVFRTLKHLLATESCRVHSADAYYGHLVLRLLGCFVLFYTSRVKPRHDLRYQGEAVENPDRKDLTSAIGRLV